MSTSLPVSETSLVARPDLRLDHLIGNGCHGTVFAATRRVDEEGTTMAVAVKIPVAGSLAHEAAMLRRFAGPGVVRLYDGPLRNGSIVTELCVGGTLASTLAVDGPQLAAVVGNRMLPIIHAVKIMHSKGWMHGDINPTNIGFRDDGSAVLFDFATAHPDDGSPLPHGTTSYIGSLRCAVATVDVRALAATIAESVAPGPTRTAVVDIVRRVDAGQDVAIDELDTILTNVAEREPTSPRRPGHPPPAAPPGQTQDFGPRPGGRTEPNPPTHPFRPLLFVAVILGITLLAFNGERRVAPASSTSRPVVVSSGTTLSEHNMTWDAGQLFGFGADNEVTWSVGRVEDQAAIGDWNCDGTATLGVYRPSTGEWFEFGSWSSHAESTVESGLPRDGRLFVEQADGCVHPLVRS